jgi:hypothetical protein
VVCDQSIITCRTHIKHVKPQRFSVKKSSLGYLFNPFLAQEISSPLFVRYVKFTFARKIKHLHIINTQNNWQNYSYMYRNSEDISTEYIIIYLFCSILLNFVAPHVNNFLANSEYVSYFDFHGMSVFH